MVYHRSSEHTHWIVGISVQQTELLIMQLLVLDRRDFITTETIRSENSNRCERM